jgi:hypothetical protein
MQVDNHARFTLAFHLPYYAWRSGKGNEDHRQHQHSKNVPRISHNVSFLDWNANGQTDHFLHEAQISCIVTGLDNKSWVAYCFVDSYFDTTATGETATCYQVNTAKSNEGLVLDPLTRGHTSADRPMLGPRQYFLKVLEIRLYQVTAEWRQVVDKVHSSVREYMEVRLS